MESIRNIWVTRNEGKLKEHIFLVLCKLYNSSDQPPRLREVTVQSLKQDTSDLLTDIRFLLIILIVAEQLKKRLAEVMCMGVGESELVDNAV